MLDSFAAHHFTAIDVVAPLQRRRNQRRRHRPDRWYFLKHFVLVDATRERWGESAVGLSVTWPSSSTKLERIIWSRTETDAGIGVRVSGWMRAANRLAELYREDGQRDQADSLDRDLAKLLAAADPDFPLLTALKARQLGR
jgi:hypothetical protein